MLTRRRFTALTATSATLLPIASHAHHGYMRWDEDNPIVIEGWVSKEMDGFPHWEIEVRVDGVDWEVDLGDQFQLKKAGLRPDGREFKIGRDIRVAGLRPMDRSILRVLPNLITLDGDKEYPIVVNG